MQEVPKTREWATARLKEGKKVTHYNFTSREYLEMKGSSIMTEDGYNFDDIFYSTSWMASGWSLHHTSN